MEPPPLAVRSGKESGKLDLRKPWLAASGVEQNLLIDYFFSSSCTLAVRASLSGRV